MVGRAPRPRPRKEHPAQGQCHRWIRTEDSQKPHEMGSCASQRLDGSDLSTTGGLEGACAERRRLGSIVQVCGCTSVPALVEHPMSSAMSHGHAVCHRVPWPDTMCQRCCVSSVQCLVEPQGSCMLGQRAWSDTRMSIDREKESLWTRIFENSCASGRTPELPPKSMCLSPLTPCSLPRRGTLSPPIGYNTC